MPRLHYVITTAEGEAAIQQFFWWSTRQALLRVALAPVVVVAIYLATVWPLRGFARDALPSEVRVALLLFMISATIIFLWAFLRTWYRVRKVVRQWRYGLRDILPATSLLVTLAMDEDGIGFLAGGSGELQPWNRVTGWVETRDFLYILFDGMPPLGLPKRRLDPAELAAIRVEIDGRLVATVS